MIEVRRDDSRGITQLDGMQTHHSFSVDAYYDPRHIAFGPLSAINEQYLYADRSIDVRSCRDSEIIIYMLDGVVRHTDSQAGDLVLRHGDVQRVSADTALRYNEQNASSRITARFLQFAIQPSSKCVVPASEKKHFSTGAKRGALRLIASNDGRNDSLLIHQDAAIYASILSGMDQVGHTLAPGRTAYVHVLRGRLLANGIDLARGDALKITGITRSITLSQGDDAELLLFDLPY